MSAAHSIARFWRRLRGQAEDPHQEQLLRLYWNRAELKKELSDLQDERQGLLSKLDTQQTTIKRASEQLDELAAYLGRPAVGAQALLYFQLRALWIGCGRKLNQLMADLRLQQEERERKRHTAECATLRTAQVAAIEERLLNAQSHADSLEARLRLVTAKLEAAKSFWKFRQRRELRVEEAQVRAEWESAATAVTDISDERASVTTAPMPDYPGLSLDGKRIVNTAAIAYAEWLILNLPNRALAPLARQAISVQIYDASLGTVEECQRIMTLAKTALAALEDPNRSLVTLKEPTERVRARAIYRTAHDVVPMGDSLAEIPIVLQDGSPPLGGDRVPAKINVLVDDYWSIAQALLQ
ncbi:MAG TPA: hypothetical protein VK629_09000 [Steroidobacteraceae bacterium]|nr:hypothetical protein [Steroidobacteraceae bacterium]